MPPSETGVKFYVEQNDKHLPKRLGRSISSIVKQCNRIHNEILAGIFSFSTAHGEPELIFDIQRYAYVCKIGDEELVAEVARA